MTLIIVFLFGLIIGSFLNAVVYRLHSGESIVFDRSHCTHCGHELAASDLVPVFSFLWLAGRCRYCKRHISWQYPLMEVLTGLVFVLLVISQNYHFNNLFLLPEIVFAGFLIVVGVFDFKYYLILDRVVYPAVALALVWDIFLGRQYFISGLWGALLVAGFFAAQYYISKGLWIGFGDVKFGLFLGLLLGFRLSLVMLISAYFIGAVVGVILITTGKKTFSSKLPFGVFLAASAILTLVFGQGIADWYFKLIGF